MDPSVDALAERLADVPGVMAVTLGGSRAQGTARPDSDWDIGLYYRGTLDPDEIRRLGYEGTVVAPGEWAYPMNGGAWLTVEGRKVDVLYRDIAVVQRWTDEAVKGRWELFRMPGYLCGFPSYVLMGEASVARVLSGRLDQRPFPERLASEGAEKWRWEARFALDHAAGHAERGDRAACRGKCSFAIIAIAQATLLERAEWALNEKGIVERTGLGDAEALLREQDLGRLVSDVRATLGLSP